MASDPISLPAGIKYVDHEILPNTLRKVSRMAGRRIEKVDFGSPYWVASYSTQFLNLDKMAEMDAWLIEAGSSDVTFLAYDLTRPRPQLHNHSLPLSGVKALGGAFDGAANLVTITDTRTVDIDGLPANFSFLRGDYIEFKMSSLIRSLHMITAAANANASGEVTLNFRFGLDTNTFTDQAVINFEQPSCVMEVVGNPARPKGGSGRRVSFEAQEVFYQ